MNRLLCILSIFLLFQVNIPGQSRYAVFKLPFSRPDYDEFSPAIRGDSLVFCSNQEDEFLLTYHNGRNKGLFNIFTVRLDSLGLEMRPAVLSRALETPFNDGPAAFSADGRELVYSRNQEVKARRRNVLKLSNRLGIYFAGLKNGAWVPNGEFPHNHPEYSITTPCYNPDGTWLYFASDMPGGYGGSDLYRSERLQQGWGEPENLGPGINTGGNEAYPFMAENGDLFFASDGHGGLGGKDIFLTRWEDGQWMQPLHLEYPLNSEADDFGLVTDGDFSEGYLSTNREQSDDIYKFYTHIPQLFACEDMQTNNYCYEFWDEEFPGIDSLPVVYEWSFSDGTTTRGLRVTHCFPGAGAHWASLNIIDDRTDTTFFTQDTVEFEILDHEQPFITTGVSKVENAPVAFSGLNSYLPGFVIEQYIWDFGDGGFAEGPEVVHVYENPGSYVVKLGLRGHMEGASRQEIRCTQTTVGVQHDPLQETNQMRNY